jgi:hypothetical protein
MMYDTTIPAKRCICDVCGYEWISIGTLPPSWCGSNLCRSRVWNGRKRPPRRDEIKLPRPPRKNGRPRTITLVDTEEQV